MRVNNHEVTSEVTLKLEFVIQLPETPQPQRCIVNVNLDSALPVIQSQETQFPYPAPFGIIYFYGKNWRTIRLSIDFVDFLVAKSFMGVVEDWFLALKKTPDRRFNDILLKKFDLLDTALGQFGRISMAAFLGAYVWFKNGPINSLTEVTLAVAIGLLIWSVFVIIRSSIARRLWQRLMSNIVPSVIVLTDGDETAYSKIVECLNSPVNTFVTYCLVIVVNIFANVFSSYMYVYLAGS